jgi:hypothetical protein
VGLYDNVLSAREEASLHCKGELQTHVCRACAYLSVPLCSTYRSVMCCCWLHAECVPCCSGAPSVQIIVEETQLFKITVSFGNVVSLISLPCYMSHASIPADVRAARGLPDGEAYDGQSTCSCVGSPNRLYAACLLRV